MPFRAGYDDDNQMKNDISSDIDSVSHCEREGGVRRGGGPAGGGIRVKNRDWGLATDGARFVL